MYAAKKVREVAAQLVVAIMVEALDGCVLDGAVHPFDLAIRPWVVRLGQSVLDLVCLADHVEAHLPGICGIPVPGLVGELDSVVGQDRVEAVRNHFQQVFQELPRRPPVGLLDQLGDCELARSVDSEVPLSGITDRRMTTGTSSKRPPFLQGRQRRRARQTWSTDLGRHVGRAATKAATTDS